ncbi:MAG TPA: hypothetical protein VMT03_25010 [Polyangia bacterium]|nr:hypothetical protein [Polyangia bacterium]
MGFAESRSFAGFSAWLERHPLLEDRPFGVLSVRYQVARYCDYLDANPWPGGDPRTDPRARDGARMAYEGYLATFGMPVGSIRLIRRSLEHFYLFLEPPR